MKRAFAIFLLILYLLIMPVRAEQVSPLGHESGEFSMDTAFFALQIAAPQTKDATAALLDGMGFEVLLQEHYDKPISDHSHTSAYTLARGTYSVRGQERTLLIVTIRGTADGEWYSNFDFAGETGADCAYAENFMAAARDIFEAVKPVLDATDAPAVLVTGYSRGAACANLLGALIDEAYGAQDVYCYTFATPNTVRTGKADYPNIFNIVNRNDAVTRMPLGAWGFRRAGTDIELADPALDASGMHEMFLSLLGVCPDIASYYGERHNLSAPGLSEDGITTYELFQAISALFTSGADTAQAESLVRTLLSADNDYTRFLSLFMGTEDSSSSFLSQHAPDVYVSLMQAYGQ